VAQNKEETFTFILCTVGLHITCMQGKAKAAYRRQAYLYNSCSKKFSTMDITSFHCYNRDQYYFSEP